MWHTAEQHLQNEVISVQTRFSYINPTHNSCCNWKFIPESNSDLVFLRFICFQKHISKRAVIVLNLRTLAIKFPSVPNRKELDLIQTTLCYLNLKTVLNPAVMTIRHTWVILNCVTSVYSTHSGNDQYDFKTDEWNKVTTAVLNTYKLARMNMFTLQKVHNFYFPHVVCPYFSGQHVYKKILLL